jgi:hypothetical protein
MNMVVKFFETIFAQEEAVRYDLCGWLRFVRIKSAPKHSQREVRRPYLTGGLRQVGASHRAGQRQASKCRSSNGPSTNRRLLF